jgi:hypothetical protein
MWRRNWTPYANAPGIYATRVWVPWQSTGARLQQIRSTAHKYKLDNGSMGAHTYTYNAMVEVEVDGLWQSEANIQQDTMIMETLVSSERFTNKELKEIKYCRMYL